MSVSPHAKTAKSVFLPQGERNLYEGEAIPENSPHSALCACVCFRVCACLLFLFLIIRMSTFPLGTGCGGAGTLS